MLEPTVLTLLSLEYPAKPAKGRGVSVGVFGIDAALAAASGVPGVFVFILALRRW